MIKLYLRVDQVENRETKYWNVFALLCRKFVLGREYWESWMHIFEWR